MSDASMAYELRTASHARLGANDIAVSDCRSIIVLVDWDTDKGDAGLYGDGDGCGRTAQLQSLAGKRR